LRFATLATEWNLRLNSRRKTSSVSFDRKVRITVFRIYRLAFNVKQYDCFPRPWPPAHLEIRLETVSDGRRIHAIIPR
jgi:hypothetical protein